MLRIDYLNLQDILEETDLNRRYEVLAFKIANEMEVMHLKEEIQGKVKERIDRHQKEFILREQLKVIREELGEDNMLSDAEEFEAATKKLKASKEIKEKLMKEIHRFKSAMNSSAENGVIRTYIETMLEMPWDKMGKDNTDCICKTGIGGRTLWTGSRERKDFGISRCPFSDKERRKSDSLSCWSAGNRKDLNCTFAFRSIKKTVYTDFTWRCEG